MPMMQRAGPVIREIPVAGAKASTPGQGQRHVQGTRYQIGHQAIENQSQMEQDRKRAQGNPQCFPIWTLRRGLNMCQHRNCPGPEFGSLLLIVGQGEARFHVITKSTGMNLAR